MLLWLAVSLGCLTFLVTYMLLRAKFSQRLAYEQRLKSISQSSDADPLMDERLRLPFSERVFQPLLQRLGRRFQQRTPSIQRKLLERRLTMAGLEMTPDQWTGWYVFSVALGAVIGGALGGLLNGSKFALLYGVVGALLGSRLPNMRLIQATAARQKRIVRALPDVLDLLTVSVQAGLGFDAALVKVAEKMQGPLPEELRQVLHEIRAGVLRKDALAAMANRTGVDELNSFVSAIVQAEQLGVSISNVLEVQSASVREKRSQRAEEEAGKAPVKMLLPMVICIFPAIFIVVLGPAVIQVMEMFAN